MSTEKWLNTMLVTIRELKLGPTFVTRFLYLGSTIILYTLCLRTNRNKLLFNEIPFVNNNIRLTDYDIILSNAFAYLYTSLNYTIQFTILPQTPNTINIINVIKEFIDRRDNDNWKFASQLSEPLPNLNAVIEVDSVQDLNTLLLNKDSWTPLKYNGTTQKYLTPYWGNITSLIDTTKYINQANLNFHINRDDEMKEMLNIYANMTDYHRVVAEYFQGGKVTPPGIWNIYAIYAAKAKRFDDVEFAEFLYVLNCALFTASIVAWKLKYNKKQSRPIQYIRLQPDQLVTTWDGTIVSNKIWKPFQQSDARTPPFPDFISGHSTFSGAASVVFNKYISSLDNLVFSKFTSEHGDMISPLLNNLYDNTVQSIKCNAGSSTVSQGASLLPFPICATVLNFNSWDQLAELSGVSRVYGGIHLQGANHVGIIVGQEIAQDILKL